MYETMHHPRKRQRRQAAALVVQSFFTIGKKSTAQPRPALHVPPRGIGPIQEPNINDVLCGRGGRINAHEGNVQFREVVAANKQEYLAKTTKKLEKAHIAARIVESIRTMVPPGRFLKEDSASGFWFDIGDAKAIKKAGQALREDAPDIRTEDGSDDDHSPKKNPPKTATPTATNTKSPSPQSSRSPPPTSAASPKRVASAAPFGTTMSTSGGGGRGSNRSSTTSGRGPQHQRQSWHSAGSSTFGMPFPPNAQASYPPRQQQQQAPLPLGYNSATGSGVNFPTTASVDSGRHSLKSGGGRGGIFPGNLYQGVRGMSTNLSKRASEMMHFQQQQHHAAAAAAFRQHRSGGPPGVRGQYPPGQHPDEIAFGRQFTPTELSSGSTMSTISGMSGISGYSNQTGSNLAGSQFGAASALSLGSSGFGPPSLPAYTNSLHASRLGPTGLRAQAYPQYPVYPTNNRRVSQVSDITNSFMNASGLARSPSFGDLSSSGGGSGIGPMSDSSFVALMAEDRAVGDILANIPPPNSSGTSPKSSGSRAVIKQQPPSAMSVTSAGSNKSAVTFSMRSVGSDSSWLLQHPCNRSNTKGSISSGEEGSRTWADDKSMMSDVSENIVALDLATSAHPTY